MLASIDFPDLTRTGVITEEAYTTIFNANWKKLYAIAYRRLRDSELAKDMVQEVFVYLWKQREHIRIKESVEAYLRGALQYQLIAHFRKENIRGRAFAYLLERMVEVEEQMKDVLVREDLEKTLKEGLVEMPNTMQAIFKLRIHNYSVHEIAESLDLTEKTVRNNISKGLHHMRKVLSREHPDDLLVVLLALHIILT